MTDLPANADGAGCPSGLAPPDTKSVHGTDLSAFVTQKGNLSRLHLSVRGAKCGGCLSKIEKSVHALPGVETARLNLSNGQMEVLWSGDLQPARIGETISNLGYGVSVHSEDNAAKDAKREERSLLIAMGVAGFAAANIMLLSVSVWGGHGEMGQTTRDALHAISGLIALPVLVFSGRHFFKSAWSVLKHGRANMDVPISLALILAFSVSVFETINSGKHAYFDAVVMLLFFLLIGRFLDARLRRQAHAAAHDLAALRNSSVNRITAEGKTETIRADAVKEGNTILLAAGERAVVDLRLTSGTSEIDESLVTGESLPRIAAAGATVYAGSVNLGQPLRGTALGAAADSLLSDIAGMLEAGEQRRSTYRKIADKAVSLYVPFVHTAALLTFVGWLVFGASIREAVMVAVATLIITCPCALALAAPVVQVVASGRLFKQGIYLKSGDALERLATVDHVVFDKTGTLTLGEPVLNEDGVDPETLSKAAMLARASRHPLSRALVTAAGPGNLATDVREFPGLGLEADLDGVTCRLGSADWVGAETAEATDGPSLWFLEGENAPVLFRFSDEPREDAAETITALEQLGLSLEVLSGDRADAVHRLSDRLGIAEWTAQASPQDKVERLENLRAEGRQTLMVGDGINDAGALSLAHASLTPGGAMDVSQSASDAVFSGGLSGILDTLSASKTARTRMQQNFALAALYNLIAIPIAVTGNVTPLIAAIAMSASSLVVTINALRR